MNIIFTMPPGVTIEQGAYLLGQVPNWLDESDPRSAAEQINEGYKWGGWKPMAKGPTLGPGNTMCYPGDPPLRPFATIEFRDERIFAYPHEFWAILKDGKAEFARLD